MQRERQRRRKGWYAVADTAERILYLIQAAGAEETARAFSQVADAMERTTKLEASRAWAQEQSGELARISAYKAEAAAVNQIGEASAKATTSVKILDAAKGQAATTSGEFRSKISAAGSALNSLASSLSSAAPSMSALNGAVGKGVTVFAQLLGVFGTGGTGLGVSGVIAAVTAFGAATSQAARDTAVLTDAIDKQKASVLSLEDRIKNYQDAGDAIAAVQMQLSANTTRLQLALDRMKTAVGVDAVEAYRKERDEVEESNKTLRTRLDTLTKLKEFEGRKRADAGEQATAAEANERDRRAIADALARAGASGTSAASFDFGSPEAPKKSGGPLGGGKQGTPYSDFIMQQAEGNSEADQIARDSDAAMKKYALDLEHHDRWMQMRKEQDEAISEGISKQSAWETANYDNLAKREEDRQKQQKAGQVAVMQGLTLVGNLGASVTAKLIMGAVEGQKQSGKAILRTIGESMIGEGTKAIFSGIIDIASQNYAGGAIKLATGAAEIAAGIGFGAAAGPVPSTAGATSAPSPSESPHRDNSTESGQAPVQNIFIEFSSLTGPTAEDGLRVRESLRNASYVYGAET